MEENSVLRKEKVYVLKNEELRVEIIWLHHNVPVAGHEERQKITKSVTRNYWWSRVIKNVRKYVDGYDLYQRMKNRTEASVEKLKLNKGLENPQTHLTVNIITKLPLAAMKNVILVVCDRLFKITYFVATTKGTSVERLARLFRNNI